MKTSDFPLAPAEQLELLHLTRDAIVVREFTGEILFWNRGAEAMYGWTAAEALGRRTNELLRTRFLTPQKDIEATTLEKGHWQGELRHVRKDGTALTVCSRWVPQRTEASRLLRILEINTDQTARRESEAALRDLLEMLQATNLQLLEANEGKRQFLNAMSHELRTPLNAIVGFAELLLDPAWGSRPGQRQEATREILASGVRLRDLVNHILEMSRLERGQAEFLDEPVDLRRIIEAVLESQRLDARRKNVQQVLSMPPVLEARGDPIRLRQVLTTLVSNAVRHAREGSAVSVHVATLNDQDVEFRIGNTGASISEEDLSRLFQPFERILASSTREQEVDPDSIGLGLAIAQHIVQAQGGTIDAMSHEGGGMVFVLKLPMRRTD